MRTWGASDGGGLFWKIKTVKNIWNLKFEGLCMQGIWLQQSDNFQPMIKKTGILSPMFFEGQTIFLNFDDINRKGNGRLNWRKIVTKVNNPELIGKGILFQRLRWRILRELENGQNDTAEFTDFWTLFVMPGYSSVSGKVFSNDCVWIEN